MKRINFLVVFLSLAIAIFAVVDQLYLSNIDPNALPEIETVITSYMMEKKEQLAQSGREKEEI